MSGRWPKVLWIVRHGESAGNVARDEARDAGLPRIALETRDVDVPPGHVDHVASGVEMGGRRGAE